MKTLTRRRRRATPQPPDPYTNPVPSGTETRYRYEVDIPKDDAAVKVRLVPSFYTFWEDEGELFDPMTPGTPRDDAGEFANLELIEAGRGNWPYGPIGIDSTLNKGKVEIKDGAICMMMTDSNNDGVINMDDNDPAVKNNLLHPGRVMRVNTDDDDNDGVQDKLQIPDQFNVPMNPAALAGTAPKIYVQDEDDLAETILYAWIDPAGIGSHTIDVYSIFPSDLVMWTHEEKESRLHRGEINPSTGRVTNDTKLATLTSGVNNNVFHRIVYMEANAQVVGNVELHAKFVAGCNPAHPNGHDSAKMTGIVFDLDIDSDNYTNGYPSFGMRVMPERSEREEVYEMHDYGLGKVMIPNWGDADGDGILDCWDGYKYGSYDQTALGNGARSENFYPIVLEIPQGFDLGALVIRFDYEEAGLSPGSGTNKPPTGDGTIRIWTKNGYEARNAQVVSAGGDLVPGTGSCTAAQLGFTTNNHVITLYVEAVTENNVLYHQESDWNNVYNNVKPTTSIKVSLEYYGTKIAEDEVRYIVSHNNPQKSTTNSFWFNVLAHEEFRQAFASAAIYDRDDLPKFGMQLLQAEQLIEMGIDDINTRLLLLEKIPGDFWTTIVGQTAPGFNAGIYYDHITGKAVLTFAGTDDFGDVVADVLQDFCLSTGQYDYALTLGMELLYLYGSGTAFATHAMTHPGSPTGIMFTGHSLGGGLASAASVVSGFASNTFNAAGLSPMTITQANIERSILSLPPLVDPVIQNCSFITAYIAENDPLDTWYLCSFSFRALGVRIFLQDEYWLPLTAHSMRQIYYGLLYRYERLPYL